MRVFILSWCGVAWAAAALALWAAGVSGAGAGAGWGGGGPARYDTATPHAPPYRPTYIPLHPSYQRYEPASRPDSGAGGGGGSGGGGGEGGGGMAPSQFILTALRTALDVVRGVNARRRATQRSEAAPESAVALKQQGKKNASAAVSGRGMDYYDEHDHYHEHDHDTTTSTAKPMKQGRYTDPWAGYYDWIINEGSFKFWSVFQLFTAALLLYACFSAIYYAKFNPVIPDYDREYDDYFLERSATRRARSLRPEDMPSGLSWIDPRAFQFIMDAIEANYSQ